MIPDDCGKPPTCHKYECPNKKCVLTKLQDGTACDDGLACTKDDACTDGSCAGEAIVCKPDDNPCTNDVCDPTTGKCNEPLQDGTACSDADLCTVGDQCLAGVCTGIPLLCLPDGDPCTVDGCDPATGECNKPVADGLPCDTDQNFCTTQQCSAGACVEKEVVSSCVPDGNPCTDDVCHADFGCYAPLTGGACTTDTDKCTDQECLLGVCAVVKTVTECAPDGNPCTDDACHAESGCYAPLTGVCTTDSNKCTDQECKAGQCTVVKTVTACAPDGKPCTDDACHAESGCYALLTGTACDDGDECTAPDKCKAGVCVGTPDPTLCPPMPCPPDIWVTVPQDTMLHLPVKESGTPGVTVSRFGVDNPIETEMLQLNLAGNVPMGVQGIQGAKVVESTPAGCGPEIPSVFIPGYMGGILTFTPVQWGKYMIELQHPALNFPMDSYFDVYVKMTVN
jgi:hypothetical protein